MEENRVQEARNSDELQTLSFKSKLLTHDLSLIFENQFSNLPLLPETDNFLNRLLCLNDLL